MTDFAQYKGKFNAWIDSSGKFIPIGYMQHSVWASDYLEKLWEDDEDWLDMVEKESGWGSGPVQVLHKWGWIRLLTWSAKEPGLFGNCEESKRNDTASPKMKRPQKETMKDWAVANNVEYNTLFKR